MPTDGQWTILAEWARFAAYLLTAVLAVTIPGLVRRHLPYYPAVVVLSVTQGLKAVWYGIADAPWLDATLTWAARTPAAEFGLQLLIIGGLSWTLTLVLIQNRVDNKATVDIDGRVHPISVETAHAEASKTLQWAGEIEAAHGHTPPLWWRRKA